MKDNPSNDDEFQFISESSRSDAMISQIKRFGAKILTLGDGIKKTDIIKLSVLGATYVVVIRRFNSKITSIELYGKAEKKKEEASENGRRNNLS